jgi:glycerol-3-phosphate dehydrogenase
MIKREDLVAQIQSEETVWDLIVIGGGASGIGAALDSAARGYKTLLLEQFDFTVGTSSRSTKLVHGGVRYLAQGDVGLVLEALRERGLLLQNAPHLSRNQKFLIPSYTWWYKPFYTIGLTMYDLLAGKLSLGRSKPFSKEKTMKALPTIKKEGLRGGIEYRDGQFDDARLGINLVQTTIEQGGVPINYMKVTDLLKENGKTSGVVVVDHYTSKEYKLKAKSVLNATGVFVDDILTMDKKEHENLVMASQGIHLVLDQEFLKSDTAIMIPSTSDGRVLFAVPWHNRVIVGTTDIPNPTSLIEPVATEEEVDFILETAARYLAKEPTRADVKSVFAGLRPLAAPKKDGKTKEISRSHKIITSESGLVTIIGGKWTTYREMGEEVVDKLVEVGGLEKKKCVTKHLKIHGYKEGVDFNNPLYFYGSDIDLINDIIKEDSTMSESVSDEVQIIKAQVVLAVRNELAYHVIDVLARRTRALFLDAKESIRIAPIVAEIMAKEMGKDKAWEKSQVESFKGIAEGYIMK